MRGNKRITSRTQEAVYESLAKYAKDLTSLIPLMTACIALMTLLIPLIGMPRT